MGPFTFLESLDNFTLFGYILIMLFFLFIFQNSNVGLNVFLALILGSIAVYYFYDRKNKVAEQEEEIYKKKLDTIRPNPKNFEDRRDIIDFLFTIQDLYPYNPPAYDELIENLTAFFTIRSDILNEVRGCGYYYQIADSKKQNALNALHSIIFTLPDDRKLTDKFDRAHKRLDTLLTEYMNEMYNACNDEILNKGINIYTKFINTGPRAANHYFDTDFTYQFY